MPMQLNPSGLATTLKDTGYSPVDIIKYKKDQLFKEKLISEKREYDTLTKMYDLGSQVIMNDYGVYQDEVVGEYNTALESSVKHVKDGGSAVEALPNFSGFTKKVSQVNQLNQDEKKYATFVDANRLMSTEQKKQAIDDRMKSVFYNEDGTKKTLQESVDISKDLSIDPSQYIDDDSVYKDFLTSSQQSFKEGKVKGGVSSVLLYPWQKEDEDGNIVTDLRDNGYIQEEVYASYMSDSDRAGQINHKAKQIADKEGITDQSKIEDIKRELVTDNITSHGDEGSKRQFQESRTYGYRSNKNITNAQHRQFAALEAVGAPQVGDSDLKRITGQGGLMGRDVSGLMRAFVNVESAILGTDGKYYLKFGKKLTDPYIMHPDLGAAISSGSRVVQANYDSYLSLKAAMTGQTTAATVTDTDAGTPVVTIGDYGMGTITSEGYELGAVIVKSDGKIAVTIDGKMEYFDSANEFMDHVGEPTEGVPIE